MNNDLSNSTVILPLVYLSPWERIQLHPSILVFCLLLLVVGVPGNILILYIYTRRININICGFFIKILAVKDLIYTAVAIPVFLVSRILPAVNSNLMCKYLTLFQNVSAVTTGVLYVLIAFQRFKKICRSHKPQLSATFAKRLTLICIIFSFVSGLPIVFILTNNIYVVEWKLNNETKFVIVAMCDFTEASKRLYLSLAFSGWLFLLLVFIITSLAVLYSLIGRHLRTHTKHLRTSAASQMVKLTRPSNLANMFFILSVIYIITVIPRLIQSVYFSQTKKQPQLEMAHLQIFDFVIQLPYLNCVVNPFVYGFSSKRFRHEVMTTLNKIRKPQNDSSTIIHTETTL